jgi:hypothetical protein
LTLNTNIMIVILAGLALCGWVYYASPSSAAAQIPALLIGIGVLIKQFNTDSKVDKSTAVSLENAHALAAVSQQTAQAIEQVSQQVNDNTHTTDETHKIVNSQRTAMMAELSAMRHELNEMKQAKAVAETSESRIISAIEGKS